MGYVKQINGDEYIDTGKLNMTIAEIKAELQKEGLASIKGTLDKQYTEEITIDDKNIVSMQEKYKLKGDYSTNIAYELRFEKMLVKPLTEGMSLIMVNAKVNNKDFNVLIKVDGTNQRYSIFLEDYLTKNNYNENMNKDDININKDEISATGYNNYIKVDAKDSYIITQYFSEYKAKMIKDAQTAYSLLNTDYSQRKYGSYNNFKKYVDNNKSRLEYANIVKYQVNEYNGQKEYVCIDNNGKYYVFLPKSVMDYKVVLDTYTIDLPEFTKKYEEASEVQKVGLNVQKVFDAINDGDYKYAYSKLDNTFKANNFRTETEFERYVKSSFYTNNTIQHDNCQKNGDLYMYDITIINTSDKNQNKINKKFIVKLKEGTDFVMSFNVK